jgi:hypothetical protein
MKIIKEQNQLGQLWEQTSQKYMKQSSKNLTIWMIYQVHGATYPQNLYNSVKL